MEHKSDANIIPANALHNCVLFLKDESVVEQLEQKEKDKVPSKPKNIEEMIKLLYARHSLPDNFYKEGPGTVLWEDTLKEGDKFFAEISCTLDSKMNLKKDVVAKETKEYWRKDPYKDIEHLLEPGIVPPKPYEVKDCQLSPDDYSSESDEPRDKKWTLPKRLRHPDLNLYTKDYWSVRKKVKNLRVGEDSCVIVTLHLLSEMDFTNEELLYGITDPGGLETLLNIVDNENFTSQICALRLLNKMADNEIISGLMVNQGVADMCFKALTHGNSEIVLEASKIILKLCNLRCMRACCRKSKGLEILLEFAEIDDQYLNKEPTDLPEIERRFYEVGLNCLSAIDKLFNSRAVRLALYRLGFVTLLKKLLLAGRDEFQKMGIRMVTLAASIESYIQIFIEEGLLDIVYKLYCSKNAGNHLEMLKTINKCLNNPECRYWLVKRKLFSFLIEEFQTTESKTLKYTMACMMRFANIEKYRRIIDKNELIPRILSLFDNPSPRIRDYAGSLMGQMSRYPKNFAKIAGNNNIGVMKLLDYVQHNSDYVLIGHVYKVLCDLSYDDEIYWNICDVTDPIAILWGGVTQCHPKIHENGCSALVPYIGPLPDSIERVSRIPGAIHDLLNITYEKDDGAKAGAITLLAKICQNRIMFKTLIEEGFDKRLLELAKTATHPRLRYAIGYGFGSCARTQRMSFSLGRRGAVDILLDWLMNDPSKYAQLGVITGLWKLSYEPINCKVIIQAKVVERLTYLSMGNNECLQNSIAGLLVNMRYLARAAELMKNMHRPHPPEPGIGVAGDQDIIHPFQYADDLEDVPA